MQDLAHSILLSSEGCTARLARQISDVIKGGHCFLISGDLGAGKSFFARSFIRNRLGADTDVPSPTFTLVQVYDDKDVEIWHCDLYRLTSPDEVIELGLDEAFDTAICLIKWPERLAGLVPTHATTLTFEVVDDMARRVLIKTQNEDILKICRSYD